MMSQEKNKSEIEMEREKDGARSKRWREAGMDIRRRK
jgi:hypothetical protein